MRPVLKWGPAHKVAIEKHYSLCDLLDLHDAMDYEIAIQKADAEKLKPKGL
jgi:hypothetical protein